MLPSHSSHAHGSSQPASQAGQRPAPVCATDTAYIAVGRPTGASPGSPGRRGKVEAEIDPTHYSLLKTASQGVPRVTLGVYSKKWSLPT